MPMPAQEDIMSFAIFVVNLWGSIPSSSASSSHVSGACVDVYDDKDVDDDEDDNIL